MKKLNTKIIAIFVFCFSSCFLVAQTETTEEVSEKTKANIY